jgi:hypothetical protein
MAIGDMWYPHEPYPVPVGDRCKNTRFTTGGDIWFDVIDDFTQDTSWDILNEWAQSISWDILNSFDQDTSWDIMNEWVQDTSWDVLNDFAQGTSWHIHPAVIEYITQFVLKYVETNFSISNPDVMSFVIKPTVSNFVISNVMDDNVNLLETNSLMTFEIRPVTTTFSLRHPLVSNFRITRVLDHTRRP